VDEAHSGEVVLSSGTGSFDAEELGGNLLELRPFTPILSKLTVDVLHNVINNLLTMPGVSSNSLNMLNETTKETTYIFLLLFLLFVFVHPLLLERAKIYLVGNFQVLQVCI
jgi:hypothetical protein